MAPRVSLALVCIAAVALLACASGSGGGSSESQAKAAASDAAPPAGSPLSKVETGMNDTQVRNILGNPDNANAYMTGKAWIPFYYGTDTRRTDWMYKGKGRVVFSRNQYTGGLKVIRVIYNPAETAGQ